MTLDELHAELVRLEWLLARHQIKSTGDWHRLNSVRLAYAAALAAQKVAA